MTLRSWLNANLQYFGLPQYTPISGEPQLNEEIRGSMLYEGGSGVMDHIGTGVWANSGYYVEIAATERVTIRVPQFTPTVASSIAVAEERDYEPSEPSSSRQESIAHRVRVIGNPVIVAPYQDPPDTTTVTQIGNLIRTETVRQITTAFSQTFVTEGTETITGILQGTNTIDLSGPFRTTTIKTFGGGFPSIQNPDPDLPAIPATGAVLQQELTTEEGTPPPKSGQSSVGLGLQLAKRITIDFRYGTYIQNPQGNILNSMVVSQKVSRTEKNFGFGVTTGGSGVGAGTSSIRIGSGLVETESWDRIAENLYRYRKTSIDPEIKDASLRESTVTASPGVSQPPATEFAPPTTVTRTEEIISTARFSWPPGAPDVDNPRDFPLGKYLQNRERGNQRAIELGTLIIGRYLAWNFGTPVTDGILTAIAQGFSCQSFVVHKSATESWTYLIDMPLLFFDRDVTYFGGEGIRMSQIARATNIATPTVIGQNPLYAVGSAFNSGAGFLI
jgi:hypothetical protein